MHAILATVGTDGDVFPYLGLGRVLRARGHRVTLAAPETYRERASTLGLKFCSLVTAEEVSRMLADPNMWHPLKCGWVTARWGIPMLPRQYEALARLAQEPGAVFVANPGLLPARLVQDKLGVPLASLLLQPGLIPSCTAPPEMTGGLTIPTWLPRPLRHVYWLGLDVFGYFLVGRALNRLRRQLSLPAVGRLFRWWHSPELVVGLFPAWFAEPQQDWPPQIRLAGFGRYDGANAELPDDLLAFCQSGPPPIAFTLGTGMAHADEFFRAAVAACEAGGWRGILLTKFRDAAPPCLPPGIIHCAFAPFRRLLPLCTAVVHHGGVGTTAAALEAGCPQLILPLAWDQPDNAARVKKLGVGESLSRGRRTAADLRAALSIITAPSIRDRCRAVASVAASTDGLEIAADLVERMSTSRSG